MIFGKTQYLNLPAVLTLLVLATCVPKSSIPNAVIVVPATQESAILVLTDTESPEVACFTPSDVPPFAFTPDSQSILVRGMGNWIELHVT